MLYARPCSEIENSTVEQSLVSIGFLFSVSSKENVV